MIRTVVVLLTHCLSIMSLASAERSMKSVDHQDNSAFLEGKQELVSHYILKASKFLWQSDQPGYDHIWPVGAFSHKFVFVFFVFSEIYIYTYLGTSVLENKEKNRSVGKNF